MVFKPLILQIKNQRLSKFVTFYKVTAMTLESRTIVHECSLSSAILLRRSRSSTLYWCECLHPDRLDSAPFKVREGGESWLLFCPDWCSHFLFLFLVEVLAAAQCLSWESRLQERGFGGISYGNLSALLQARKHLSWKWHLWHWFWNWNWWSFLIS